MNNISLGTVYIKINFIQWTFTYKTWIWDLFIWAFDLFSCVVFILSFDFISERWIWVVEDKRLLKLMQGTIFYNFFYWYLPVHILCKNTSIYFSLNFIMVIIRIAKKNYVGCLLELRYFKLIA